MKLLIKQALIADTQSSYNGLTQDILIEHGIITAIANDLSLEDAVVIKEDGLTISPGWVDTFSHFNDPGFEFKETIESGSNAAAAGGYTTVFVIPNTQPAISNKGQVEYLIQKSKELPVNILPLGAVTKNTEGKELAEMYDMLNSGAVAFSDGLNSIQTPSILLKALQYVKSFNGVIIQMPVDNSIAKHGLINEGVTSTRLGLPGIPSIAEELIISRDLELARYTESRIHFTSISTKKSVELIASAKAEGIAVTCSVTPYHLFFSDNDLHDYDTNLKVNPPLRTKADVEALRQAVLDGHIDCIASHHLPQDWDHKVCEFEYAQNGMVSLESCFAVVNTILPQLSVNTLIDLFSNNARNIFGLSVTKIEKDEVAELTMFSKDNEYIFLKEHLKSKSQNSPFINARLRGKVIGTINKDNLYLNK